jgi:hypothetical protein
MWLFLVACLRIFAFALELVRHLFGFYVRVVVNPFHHRLAASMFVVCVSPTSVLRHYILA